MQYDKYDGINLSQTLFSDNGDNIIFGLGSLGGMVEMHSF